MIYKWKRVCQECGNVTLRKVDSDYNGSANEGKCRKCQSLALDYGYMVRIPETIEDSEILAKECEE